MTPEQFVRMTQGKPWVSGESGPDAFDCWGLVRAYYGNVLNIALPVVDVDACNHLAVARAFRSNHELSNWSQIDTPEEGCGVELGFGKKPHHVGMWILGKLLHSVEGAGVVHSSALNLKISGWNILGYYRHQ